MQNQDQGNLAGGSKSVQTRSASWVIRVKATGVVLFETFDRKAVAALNTTKYEAVPILDYLVGLNAAIKAEAA